VSPSGQLLLIRGEGALHRLGMAGQVQFILGRAGSGKTLRVLDAIIEQLTADPWGPQIWLIVPDQATLLYERLLVARPEIRGYARCRVAGFRQFGQRILEEVGGASIPEITSLGRRMLVGRLLRTRRADLHYYGVASHQPGTADTLDRLFAEFEQAGLSDADLDFLAADVAAQTPASQLPAKLRDLRVLYAEYERHLGQAKLDPHRRQQQVLRAIESAETLRGATMYVDSFHGFRKVEREMLASVARAGCAVQIALTFRPADVARAQSDVVVGDLDPFRGPILAYRALYASFAQARITPGAPVLLHDTPRFVAPALKHIDAHLFDRRSPAAYRSEHVRFVETPTCRDEVVAAALQVRDWIDQHGLRLRDVAVLARSIDEYEREVQQIFAAHGLRCFVDRQRPASHHPLLQACRSVLQAAQAPGSSEAYVSLAKSGLTDVPFDAAHALELYVADHRIAGEHWLRAQPWAFAARTHRVADPEDDERARPENELNVSVDTSRRQLVNAIGVLRDSCAEPTCTVREHARALLTSLDQLGVRRHLSRWIDEEHAAGQPELADEHRQVWTQFAELLDEMVDVLGDEVVSLDEFAQIVDVGLEKFCYAIVPPTVDQVIVGSLDRTRLGPVRAVVLLGLAEGQFPTRPTQDVALNDAERSVVNARHADIREGSRQQLFDEFFLAYLGLTRASEFLTVTRSTIDAEKRPRNPSPVWMHLRRLLPKNEPVTENPQAVDCIASPEQLVDQLLGWARDTHAPEDAGRLTYLYQHLTARNGALAALREAVLPVWRSLQYTNRPRLSAEVAAALFGEPLRSSISRLESFAACPFQHFAKHGLSLRVLQDGAATPIDLGTVYHGILERLVREAVESGHDLREPIPDVSQRIRTYAEQLGREVREEVLLSSRRNEHLLHRAADTLDAVVEAQRRLLGLGKASPAHLELSFGDSPHDTHPPLKLTTPKGRTVVLRGKIDRIDLLSDGGAYAVVDYKTSATAPDLDRIYLGMGLQLLAYLLMVEQANLPDARFPAAALYVGLRRTLNNDKHPSDSEDPSTDRFHLAKNKARGVIHRDYVDMLDDTVEPGKQSIGFSFRKLKDGGESDTLKHHDVFAPRSFSALLTWTRRTIGSMADEMIDGNINVEPFKITTTSACVTCDFRSVCRFDRRFNHYKVREKHGDDTLDEIISVLDGGAA
jgi:ATP-dependent helicase/nuclease subunit B